MLHHVFFIKENIFQISISIAFFLIGIMMIEKGIALCPTLAAGDATAQYKSRKKGIDPEPVWITATRKSFQSALWNGVTIRMGGDVGMFAHGYNARETEMIGGLWNEANRCIALGDFGKRRCVSVQR